jgi:hypothetical protein
VIGLDREGWILTGFAALFFAAVIVSACGWVLLWRSRRPADEPVAPEELEPPRLGPANPLR